jgi:hypothetical protein
VEDLRPLDEKLDERLSNDTEKSTLGFRLVLGSDGSVTAFPPEGHERHTMSDEHIIEAVKHMVEGAEVIIVAGKDS